MSYNFTSVLVVYQMWTFPLIYNKNELDHCLLCICISLRSARAESFSEQHSKLSHAMCTFILPFPSCYIRSIGSLWPEKVRPTREWLLAFMRMANLPCSLEQAKCIKPHCVTYNIYLPWKAEYITKAILRLSAKSKLFCPYFFSFFLVPLLASFNI